MNQLVTSPDYWREQARKRQAELDDLRPQLIEAETQLAERLAAIAAFEFKLRSRIEPLMKRLERLESDIRHLRRELYQRHNPDRYAFSQEQADGAQEWRFDPQQGAAASGEYRYRDQRAEKPQQKLDSDQSAQLKQLYRQLARRFHPDLAYNDEDRAHRTDMMMRINAAYAAGDLAVLEELVQEPDRLYGTQGYTDEELANALAREIERCQRRLREIQRDLERLGQHKSAPMMHQAGRAEASGKDFFSHLAREIRRKIERKQVERDILADEVARVREEGVSLDLDDLADTVYNLGLEEAFVEEEGSHEYEARAFGGRNPRGWDEDDILDDPND